jgi:aspartate aminotransferase-like enzyme
MFKERLLTPGPTPIPQQVLQAMERPLLHHRSELFKRELQQACDGMRWVLGWDSAPIFLACSGTGAMEASLLNCCSPGDEIISVNGGVFGARWRSIGERLGLTVHEVIVPWGKPASTSEVLELLRQHPAAKAICLQHAETSTTVLHPLAEILSEIKKFAPHVLTIVDGISACVTTPMPGGPATVDVYIAGSQKAFMLPPGLSMIALSTQAWKAAETTPKRSLYFDLSLERKSLAVGETSWTPTTTIIAGLNAAIQLFREEGLDAIYARHSRLSRIARGGIQALGCELLSHEAPCPSVTGFFPAHGIEADMLRSEVRKQYGIRLAGGQGKLAGKIVRIGHMGYIDAFEVTNAISAIGLVLNRLGKSVDVAQATRVCLEEF